jgi:hypothetical protein
MVTSGIKAFRKAWRQRRRGDPEQRAVIAPPCLLYSMDLTVLYLALAVADGGPEAKERAPALDHRHLRLHARRLSDHDGHPG